MAEPVGLVGQFQSFRSNPKTVLGFFGVVLGILTSGGLVAVWRLGTIPTMTWLVPWTLGFVAFFFVALVGVVVAFMAIDPSRLQLGPVTGSEYAQIQRVLLGDSLHGEHLETVALAGSITDLGPPGGVIENRQGTIGPAPDTKPEPEDK